MLGSQPRPREEANPAPTGLVAVDGRVYPLRSAALRARAEAGVATTIVVQEFENPHAAPLEVIYTLPLPADGAVVRYTIRLGERTITGKVEKRQAARAAYWKALEEGRTAGLLEQERSDTFTQTLGSLPPGVPVRVEIEVFHPLGFLVEADDAEPRWEYRFPTVAGVRYHGAPGRVADAGKLDPDRAGGEGTPVRLTVDLSIGDGAPEAMCADSPSWPLAITAVGAATRVELAKPQRLDRDVVIRWRACREQVVACFVEGEGLTGDHGRYGMVTLTPPRKPARTLARDVTLLLDASGSMSGAAIEQAKRVSIAVLRSLGPGDRFEVVAFSSQVARLGHGRVPATEGAVASAIRAIERLSAGGGTEMHAAILDALEGLVPDSQRQVILFTDGYIGFEQEIVRELMHALPAGARVHVVGVGAAPNRGLTRGAARAGRGTEHLVGIGDDAHAASDRLIRATAAPVLTGIEIDGSALRGAAPRCLPDVLAAQPLRIAVELGPEGGDVVLHGHCAGSDEPWVARIVIPPIASREVSEDRLPLGALYGRERIEDLEMQLAAAGAEAGAEVLAEIEAVGLRHRTVSRRTSMIAISEDTTVDPQHPRRRERLAVEMPAEVSAEGVGLAAPPFLLARMSEPAALSFCFDGPLPQVSSRTPLRGRVIRFDAELLVVEFESDGMVELPPGGTKISAEFESGSPWTGHVVGRGSTHSGRHARGLTLRLEVRFPRRLFPDERVPRTLRWETRWLGVVELDL